MTPTPGTEIVRASELQERVVTPIFEIRFAEEVAEYKTALRTYNKRRGKRPEVVGKVPKEIMAVGDWTTYLQAEARGYYLEVHGQKMFFARPRNPGRVAYRHSGYGSGGLLAHPVFNRDIRPQRVDGYVTEMEAGRWTNLLSDPIAVTSDGHVVNGQHRIAAATRVDWSKVDNDPLFLVVWRVDPEEALHADGSRRTARDEKTIATKFVTPRLTLRAVAPT